jgi:pimeloyl-ACP methyl ester carboxylesterase
MYTNIAGIKSHYQHIGKKGPFLVLLHGWGCDWQIWHSVIIELSENFQLLIPDLPTFGQSAQPDDVWDLDDYADWLEQFIKTTVKDKNFILAGHSFGGQIASTYVAQKTPPHLKKLILIDSAGLADPLKMMKKMQLMILGIIPKFLKNSVPFNLKKQVLNLSNSATDYLESTPYQKKVLKKVVHDNIAADLIKIKVKTLIIWGRHDKATPLHQGEKFHRLIKDAKLLVFENSGHFPFIDEAVKFINVISL